MQPHNTDERKKAFINFLLLFALSILIILTTVFFSIQVPLKENSYLRKQVDIADKDREFSTKFMSHFIQISRTLDTINKTSSIDAERLDIKVKEEIGKLDATVSDTVYNKDFYLNVSHNLGYLQASLKELRDKSIKSSDDNSTQQRMKELSDKMTEYHDKYIECLAGKK